MAKQSKAVAKVVPLKVRKCPICGKPAQRAHQPFCSGRCADIDLGRWLNEDYRIPTSETPSEQVDDGVDDESNFPGKR